MNTDLVSYYRDRAEEYERIYSKPERQPDLAAATEILQNIFADKNVLEIACGTGCWTERIGKSANSVLATDINEAVINVARRKKIENQKITFGVADIYSFPLQARYESLFGGFIWSHIDLRDIGNFLDVVNRLVVPGGTVVFIDNNYVDGSSSAITKTDANGNTFQARKLDDETVHLVLKNFPSERNLQELLTNKAGNINIIKLTYYWILCYTTPVD